MDHEKSDVLKEKIAFEIRDFVKRNAAGENFSCISTIWDAPLVGFADASHPYILSLKKIISPSHSLPTDVLDDASVILAYYVPFKRSLAKTNSKSTRLASPEWALAYEQTNSMFNALNTHLTEYLKSLGYRAAVSKETRTFNRQKLICNWSHRHFAYAAGLGTFGLNNMLITKNGCCGRYFTIVTNLDVQPDEPMKEELCLHKKNGSCGACVRNCPVGALSVSAYDRQKCYSLLRENAEIYTEFGNSYSDDTVGDGDRVWDGCTDGNAKNEGSEVCGKCVASSPCAFWNIT